MPQIGLDTSVVVRLLVGEPVNQALKAKEFLDEIIAEGKTPVVSDLVVSEVYFALCYHYSVSKADALGALKSFFKNSPIENFGIAKEILKMERLSNANPGFVDRIIHLQYLESASQVATFEKSAKKLKNAILLK